MDSFKENSKAWKQAIKYNRRRNDRELAQANFSHEKHTNFPDPNKKSKFDMTDKYYNKHMKR